MINRIKVVTFNKELYKEVSSEYKREDADIIVSIGGDGTFIHAIQSNKDKISEGVLFYGVAKGTLNFLMNEHFYENINEVLKEISENDRIGVIETPILRYYKNNEYKGIAINEVVYGESIRDYPEMRVSFGRFNKTLKGSMISMSSPIGSTGLNKNINGRVIPKLEYRLMTINTIASDYNINKVLEDNSVSITQIRNRGDISILADNQIVCKMSDNDVLMVELGENIRIGFKDIESFEKKRVLSTVI